MCSKALIYNVQLVDYKLNTPGAVETSDGIITAVITDKNEIEHRLQKTSDGTELINGNGLTLLPAFVDMHAHFRYPGQTQKEEPQTALRAAAAGGFGTLVLMPNTTPVMSNFETAKQIQTELCAYGFADVIQTMSISADFKGTDTSHLDNITKSDIPVISEDGHDVQSAALMLQAMRKCAEKGIIVSCHCEDVSLVPLAAVPRKKAVELQKAGADAKTLAPLFDEAEKILALAEDTATERNLRIAHTAGCNIHIAHVSTRESIDAVRRAKKTDGSRVTCEVTPHHLALTNTRNEFVNPPLRSEDDRQALLEAIKDSTVDVISTDHAPHTESDKQNGACGFTGLETAFAVCYTNLVKTNLITINKLSELMSANPAKRLGLNCGALAEGKKADLVLADLNRNWKVDSSKFFSKGKYSPFNGEVLSGRITATFHNGRKVFSE
ncbi:MAG: dihydroorotase [Spirochaetaceae bacterium]|nr:dihydroorotase [Spirochaetaceae bacterium]